MDISVVAAARENDSPPLQALAIATIADRLAYPEVWIDEGPTWDAFTLATAIRMRTKQIALTAGPAPIHGAGPGPLALGWCRLGEATDQQCGAQKAEVTESSQN